VAQMMVDEEYSLLDKYGLIQWKFQIFVMVIKNSTSDDDKL
jgi:hypothetical protein